MSVDCEEVVEVVSAWYVEFERSADGADVERWRQVDSICCQTSTNENCEIISLADSVTRERRRYLIGAEKTPTFAASEQWRAKHQRWPAHHVFKTRFDSCHSHHPFRAATDLAFLKHLKWLAQSKRPASPQVARRRANSSPPRRRASPPPRPAVSRSRIAIVRVRSLFARFASSKNPPSSSSASYRSRG